MVRERLRSALEQEPNVTAAWLYGSAVRGESHEGSDVDLGVLLADDVDDPLEPSMLADRLERRAGLPANRLDLRVLNDGTPRFHHQVLARGELIFERDAAERVAFETRALARYYDFLPYLRVQDRAQRERFRRGSV